MMFKLMCYMMIAAGLLEASAIGKESLLGRVKGLYVSGAQKGSPVERDFCGKAALGTSTFQKCVVKHWCDVPHHALHNDIGKYESEINSFHTRGCPASLVDKARRQMCMRLCAKKNCQKTQCVALCSPLSVKDMLMRVPFQSSFGNLKEKLSSKMHLTLEKVELLQACLGQKITEEEKKIKFDFELMKGKKYKGIMKKLKKLRGAFRGIVNFPHVMHDAEANVVEIVKSREKMTEEEAKQHLKNVAAGGMQKVFDSKEEKVRAFVDALVERGRQEITEFAIIRE